VKRKEIRKAGALIREQAQGEVDCAIVLGSGLGHALDAKVPAARIAYAQIPGMPHDLISGQPGFALAGRMNGRRVVAFAGRFHLYQGYRLEDVVAPVLIAIEAGARTIVLTNAAGGLNADYATGDIMLIADHINLLGANPLTGTGRAARGEAFVDMIDAYSPELRLRARTIASGQGVQAYSGTYAAVPGPSFETPAEARMLRAMGADAVGMSTVLETIAARAHGIDVLGISLITNVVGTAGGGHEHVMSVARANAGRFANLIEGVVATL
jgi:purine-nucleoside phosphorylase